MQAILDNLELNLYLLLALAFVTQQVTKQIARHLPQFTAHVAALVGILVAVLTSTGLISTLGLPVTVRWPWVDQVLAGLLFAGGAGVIHAVAKFLGKGPAVEPEQQNKVG